MVRVKICGNTDAEQIKICVEAGADCVGFVVEYPVSVPWNLTRDEAADLLPLVPPFVTRAVVTGGSAEFVLGIADHLRPEIIQLHTDNPIHETTEIAKKLTEHGIRLIRALRIDVATGKAGGEIEDPISAARALENTGISALLLDAHTADMPAGTGITVSWEIAKLIRESVTVPIILAGGLNSNNIRDAIRAVRPYAVDVITGVEASRRVKDPVLVREFIRCAKITE
ncbi:MAG: phosphoribosylanthranilate isomerase [Armatimonadetes bacterium]|nr:phosphoribosylanthranilate isomerase [Armatimonadota bacterium]